MVGELLKHYHAFIETLRRMPKIVLSSVHGSAAGAGMGLAFVADLCIAAEDARFTPAYAKIGVSPDGGSTVGMVGTVGIRRALQIFLAEDSFSAQQAHDWGLVAKVVPAAELKAATRQFAERLAQNPPAAIGGTKSLVYQAALTPTKQQLDAEEAKIIDCHAHRRISRRGEEVHEQGEVATVTSSLRTQGLMPTVVRRVTKACDTARRDDRPSSLRTQGPIAAGVCRYEGLDCRLTDRSRGMGPGVRGPTTTRVHFGQIYPVPAGDLKQPTDSGITCFGSHSTTFGK